MQSPYSAERLNGACVVIDRLDVEGAALAQFLRRRGAVVVLADPDPVAAAPDGCSVVADRVEAVALADVVLVDCWTGEVEAHVIAARARGVPVRGLADIVLHEAKTPVVGVTGTAGKTTTARLIAHLLRATGHDVLVAASGRAENAWPNVEVLTTLAAGARPDLIVLELTSTHLAYTSASPGHAVVTSLWPDHVELHGSEAAYFAAKQQLLAGQQAGSTAVLPVGETRLVVQPGVQVSRFSAEDPSLRSSGLPTHVQANVAAAVALLQGSLGVVDDLTPGLASFEPPVWRGEEIGTVAGRPVFHNGMAATPAKAAAFLAGLPDRSAVLIVGGLDELGVGVVHASPGESLLLEEFCRQLARAGQQIVLVGPAALRVAPLLARNGRTDARVGPDLDWAVNEALRWLNGVETVAWVPGFPAALADRARFGELMATAAETAGLLWASAGAAARAKSTS